jgi:hypothetical protein
MRRTPFVHSRRCARSRPTRFVRPQLECLEDRLTPSVSASFTGTPFLTAGADVNVSRLPLDQSEVAIAVNPADPANLIAFANNLTPGATQDVAYFSRDAGQTWTQTLIPNPAGQVGAGDPTVAFDRAGNAYLAHLTMDASGGLNVGLARSSDGGETWTASLVVGSGDADKEMLVVGPDPIDPSRDNVYLAYRRDVNEPGGLDVQIHLAASYDGGLTFPTDVIVNDDSITGRDLASFAVPVVAPTADCTSSGTTSATTPPPATSCSTPRPTAAGRRPDQTVATTPVTRNNGPAATTSPPSSVGASWRCRPWPWRRPARTRPTLRRLHHLRRRPNRLDYFNDTDVLLAVSDSVFGATERGPPAGSTTTRAPAASSNRGWTPIRTPAT